MGPPGKRSRPPGVIPGAAEVGNALDTPHIPHRAAPPQHLRQNPRFHRLTERLHQLGPRCTGELLLELIDQHDIEGDVLARLEFYAGFDPAAVAELDGRHWPPTLWRAA